MKLALALLASSTGAMAFLPSCPTHLHPTTTTTLHVRVGIGFDITNLYTTQDEDNIRAQNDIMKYLDLPPPVAIRPNLGSTVLVSGFDPSDASATMVLDFLNSEDSPHFRTFTKIVAFVEDGKLARKRLIGRNARYTGLLDKLDFSVAEEGALVPSQEQLTGVSSWVAHCGGGDLSRLRAIVEAAEAAPSVENVAILVSGAKTVGSEDLKEAEEMLKSKALSFKYTLVVVGEWNDARMGS